MGVLLTEFRDRLTSFDMHVLVIVDFGDISSGDVEYSQSDEGREGGDRDHHSIHKRTHATESGWTGSRSDLDESTLHFVQEDTHERNRRTRGF